MGAVSVFMTGNYTRQPLKAAFRDISTTRFTPTVLCCVLCLGLRQTQKLTLFLVSLLGGHLVKVVYSTFFRPREHQAVQALLYD